MIVVDTNVIAYLFLGGQKTPQARQTFQKDPHWAAPILWRSEFRNVVATYLKRGQLVLSDALELVAEAESLLDGSEYRVESGQVLSLASTSPCSAYDCEFVALAQELGVPLVTSDAQLLKSFPAVAVALDAF
ncbi:MAG: type II toxin-antitoxin system VapC family toxin [Thermoleophilia bacterium]|nr:type II toxin-antitoxin system VapC family toxin [Thermoleophilia bacterium]